MSPLLPTRRRRTGAGAAAPPAGAKLSFAALALVIAALPLAAAPSAPASPRPAAVVVARLDTIIHPVAAEFVAKTLAHADAEHAAAVVLEIDTPGGLMTSMGDITRAIVQARTPVVCWVGPEGARAASAGFFVLMSCDVAAMAPGTNTGAAHPVGGKGEDIAGHLGKKVEQDAAAQIRSLAARHGRNVELAQAAVVDSKSFTADEALQGKLVEIVAPSVPALVQALDGRPVKKGEGAAAPLHTAGARLDDVEMGKVQRFFAVLAQPDIAYLLLAIGMLGLYFEIATPGAVLPGVLGATCLVLGFYALSVLPVSFAGAALLLLAALFFLAEIKITSYGLLTVAGTICLVLGSLMLFESPEPALRVSRSIIAGVAASAVVTALFLMTLVFKAHRAPVTTGAAGLVGERGVAKSALEPRGRVFVHGELWTAVSEAPAPPGAAVEVVAMDGMTLRVRPLPATVSPLVAPSSAGG
ncbi:MAG TPA: nodulation protein NfeD [Thermoanaerobaculia bacterium]|jgi:membrane-bound serine protease (ClpP class)|nr:nodulation protein NfeD [Thermoanaerobaculia bacterium]